MAVGREVEGEGALALEQGEFDMVGQEEQLGRVGSHGCCCSGGVDGDDSSGWWMAGGCRVHRMRRYGNQQRASMLEGDIIIPRPEAPAPESGINARDDGWAGGDKAGALVCSRSGPLTTSPLHLHVAGGWRRPIGGDEHPSYHVHPLPACSL